MARPGHRGVQAIPASPDTPEQQARQVRADSEDSRDLLDILGTLDTRVLRVREASTEIKLRRVQRDLLGTPEQRGRRARRAQGVTLALAEPSAMSARGVFRAV